MDNALGERRNDDDVGGRRPVPVSGEVRGSSAGAGGSGNADEFDDDDAGGDGERARTHGDIPAQAPLARDRLSTDLARRPNDAEETSDADRPTSDHDPMGWRGIDGTTP